MQKSISSLSFSRKFKFATTMPNKRMENKRQYYNYTSWSGKIFLWTVIVLLMLIIVLGIYGLSKLNMRKSEQHLDGNKCTLNDRLPITLDLDQVPLVRSADNKTLARLVGYIQRPFNSRLASKSGAKFIDNSKWIQ